MNIETLTHHAANIDKAEQAYQDWRALNLKTADTSTDESLTDDEWAMIDDAEKAVLNCTDTTPRAAERKLWIALMHDIDGREFGPWILAEDITRLQSEKIDWPQRLQISAIASLQCTANA